VRFFVDECISPSLSRHLNETGLHDAIHPRDRGRLREPDHVVFARAIEEDRIIVTENADDFRKLAAAVDLHPGLIILPSVARAEAQRLMDLVVELLLRLNPDRPQDVVVNSALTITRSGSIRVEPLP
jgi:predicted nuclease of predicted toxin-antitoxin system